MGKRHAVSRDVTAAWMRSMCASDSTDKMPVAGLESVLDGLMISQSRRVSSRLTARPGPPIPAAALRNPQLRPLQVRTSMCRGLQNAHRMRWPFHQRRARPFFKRMMYAPTAGMDAPVLSLIWGIATLMLGVRMCVDCGCVYGMCLPAVSELAREEQ